MAIGEIEPDLDPLPALGPDLLRFLVELLGDEHVDQADILQPAAVVALEQVAHDRSARFDIGVDADELHALVGGAHRVLGQHAADLVGLLVVALPHRLPHLFLTRMVGIDRERHQLVEAHLVAREGVEQWFADRNELQPLLDDVRRDEERRGDLLLRHAGLAHRLEGAELVERMERRALDVLGEAVLLGAAAFAHDARNERGLRQAFLLHEEFERTVAPPAGRHLEHAGLLAARVGDGAHGDARQQRAPGDVLGEFLDRNAGLDLPHIRLAQHQLVERDVPRRAERDGLD